MTTYDFRHIAIRLLNDPAESVTDSQCRSEVIERVISFRTTSESITWNGYDLVRICLPFKFGPLGQALQIFLSMKSRRSAAPRAFSAKMSVGPLECLGQELSYPSLSPDDLQATSRLRHTRDGII